MSAYVESLILTGIAASLLISAGCAGRQPAGAVRERIANAYGVEEFNRINQLRYTFNAKIGDKRVVRSWLWQPAANRVTYFGPADQGGTVTYTRNTIAGQPSDEIKRVDAWFINDQYWLLFPLHLAWDRDTTIEADTTRHNLPIGKGEANRITVTYPPTGGYTPGDVYELYVGRDDMITQWIYRKGGSPEPTRISTWEDNRKVGPITISLNHKGPDENFRVWFTDVAVQVNGEEGWHRAR
jgi:hypothetical protein